MNTTLKRTFVAASVALAFTASAQTKAPLPEPLLQAIHKAVATNPDVQAKWNAFQAADSQRDVAKAGFFPTVDLSASAGTESRVTGGVDLGSYSVNSTQITLDQILFDGLYTVNEVKRLGAAKLTRYYE